MTEFALYAWMVVMTVGVAVTATLLMRCFLRSRAVERRIEREINAIWGD